MQALIAQKNDNENFMYCIDTLKYHYLKYEDDYICNRRFNHFQEIRPKDVLQFALNRGEITLSKYIEIISRR